jgi:hypothetical protein
MFFLQAARAFSFTLIIFTLSECASDYSPQKPFFSIHYDPLSPRSAIAVIIPGMNQRASDPGYDSIGSFYKIKGITPVYVNIDWKAVGLGKLSAAALQMYGMLKDSFPQSKVYLFGFSFGAVICLKLSQSIQAKHILLCSMSP